MKKTNDYSTATVDSISVMLAGARNGFNKNPHKLTNCIKNKDKLYQKQGQIRRLSDSLGDD